MKLIQTKFPKNLFLDKNKSFAILVTTGSIKLYLKMNFAINAGKETFRDLNAHLMDAV